MRQRLPFSTDRFKHRAPTSSTLTLSLRNVYIFFSQEGIFYAILLVITFIAGINYANNLVLGLCFLLASLLVVTLHYTFSHLAGLTIKLVDVQATQVGAPMQIYLQVSGRAKQPHCQVRLSFKSAKARGRVPLKPLKKKQTDKIVDTVEIGQIREPQIICLQLPTTRRGKVTLPTLTISTVYPLGILRAWSYMFLTTDTWVYPAPLAYDMTIQAHQGNNDIQAQVIATPTSQDEFDQLDRYQPGEALTRISWSHLARGQGLLAKRFVDTAGQETVLDYYHMPAYHHEDKLRQLRYGIDVLSQQSARFRLRLPDGEGQMGQGAQFVQASLLRLAKTP